MALSPLIERLFARLDALSSELAATTGDLVRFPTVDPPGHAYGPALEYIARYLAPHGFSSRLIRAEGAPGDSDAYPRLNLMSRIEGARPGRTFHITGHVDVVDAGPGWSVDPFDGTIRDGRVYGRGASDMKGGLASAMFALAAIADLMPDFAGALELSATVDGETGGQGGLGHLVQAGWLTAERVDHVLLPEPLGPGRIGLGHRGLWVAEIGMTGAAAHGGAPALGASALAGIGEFIAMVEAELAPALAERTTRVPVLPEAARRSTVNIAAISGGVADGALLPAAVVVDRCRVVIDRRYIAEESLEAVRLELIGLAEVAAARHGLELTVRDLAGHPPAMAAPDGPAARALTHWIEVVTGRAGEMAAGLGGGTRSLLAGLGGFTDIVAYGPGRPELAHLPDEWVGIDDLVTAAKVMAATALTLTGSFPPG
jgi:succinyl-diaminopimelate desuccinylase